MIANNFLWKLIFLMFLDVVPVPRRVKKRKLHVCLKVQLFFYYIYTYNTRVVFLVCDWFVLSFILEKNILRSSAARSSYISGAPYNALAMRMRVTEVSFRCVRAADPGAPSTPLGVQPIS